MFKKSTALRVRIGIIFPALYLFLVAGTLIAGLWPCNFYPTNHIFWEFDSNGKYLSFNHPSFAYLSPSLKNINSPDGFSIEIKLKPFFSSTRYIPRIISVQHKNNELLMIGQWKSGIIFRLYDSNKKNFNELICVNAFESKEPVLITFCTGESGTSIYCNGKCATKTDKILISAHSSIEGIAVLGNSITGDQSWNGKLYDFKFCNRSLSEQKIRTNSQKWTHFPFRSDSYVLMIPQYFSPLKKKILTPPWVDFQLKTQYVVDAFLNLIGFFPSGFILGIILIRRRVPIMFALLISFFLCSLISLTIELLQTILPSRTSQLSDLILNVFGGFFGTWLLYHIFSNKEPINSHSFLFLKSTH